MGRPSLSLARFASGRKDESVSTVGAFHSDVVYPVWIGKTSSDKRGMDRLRKERDALVHLQPWSPTFQIPVLVHFEESETQICLIQTGVSGFPSLFANASGRDLPRHAIQALELLEKFQSSVQPPEVLTLRAMVDRVLQDLQLFASRNSAIDGLANILRHEQPGDDIQLVATHGDFVWGNILFSATGVGVVDWEELRTGFALDDVLTLILSCVQLRITTTVEAFQHAFYSSTEAGRYLSNRIRNTGMSIGQARFWFYLFVARRLIWKRFDDDWQALLVWFLEKGYPTPTCFTAARVNDGHR